MIPDIAALMAHHFQEDVPFFERILSLDWKFGFEEVGKALLDGARLVGFFGLHHSLRLIRGDVYRISAMHGVVVERAYRRRGTDLLTEAALSDPEGNYIAWTANSAMDKRYRRAGFRVQNADARLIWPGSTAQSLWTFPFLRASDQASFARAVDPSLAKLYEDHCGTRLNEHFFFAFGRPLGLITRRAYHKRKFPISEIAYVNDAALLRKVFEPVRLVIHRRERTVALKINPPELGFAPRFASPIPGTYLYKSAKLGPGDFNLLYGEILILG